MTENHPSKTWKVRIRLLTAPFLIGAVLLAALFTALGWQLDHLSVANAQALVRYVTPTGADTGACDLNPCRTVQYAVMQSADGDEVRIAAGIYTGTSQQAGLTQMVFITRSITLRGGYAPPDWTTSDADVNPTVLDAQTQGRVITIIGAADVTIEGLRLVNGLSAGMGGLYMNQYTCGVLFGGSGAGGGVCIQDSTVSLNHTWILSSTAGTAGGRGGGLFAVGAQLTLTGSRLEGNNAGTGFNKSYGGGLFLIGGLAHVENNIIKGNSADPNYEGDGGGIYILGAQALLKDNIIQENWVNGSTGSASRLGGGGVAVNGGGVTVTGNRILANQAVSYLGGGLAWTGGPITVTANLLQGNHASWGGGMYAGNAPAQVDSNVLAGNIANDHGGAIFVNTFNPNLPSLRHNTITGSSGGDGSAIYAADYGRAVFYNTIMADNIVGVGLGWGTNLSFNRTLWDNNITDTLGLINEVGHLDGSAGFSSDGYHLTEQSDAVDAGIDAGVNSDVDGEARPQGSAPDIGADESPFGQAIIGDQVEVEQVALAPRLRLTTHSANGMPLYLVEQEYLIRLANGLTDTAINAYTLQDWLPTDLDFAGQVAHPPMDFSWNGSSLIGQSGFPLRAGELAWASLVGHAQPADGGKVVTNTASLTYTLDGGVTANRNLQVGSLIPNFPPFITFPENGEYCLNSAHQLEIQGLAKPEAVIQVYADGVFVLQVTASISGAFSASWQPAQWAPNTPVVIHTRDCTGGNCGDLSNVVTVRQPANGWCPQRSIWEGILGENTLRWPFRDAHGDMSTQDWEIPGAYGFHDTTLNIYPCELPDPGYAITDIVVQADGAIYHDPYGGPGPDGSWSFNVGYAHNVSIIVTGENSIGATKTYTSHGSILVDPDGFIFDVNQGLDVISSTLDGVPIEVSNGLAGVTVTCMVSIPQWGGWVAWPAQYYNHQVNPQVTGADGYFAFFTPPGHYYLQVEGLPGYQSWQSPVVEVITEIVHANVPLTPWTDQRQIFRVDLDQTGPNPQVLTIPAGSVVEWVTLSGASLTIEQLANWKENPWLRPHSLGTLDPLKTPLGFDGGRQIAGQIYRRRFLIPGTYFYTDEAGHSGQIIVLASPLLLPLVRR